MCKTKLKEKDYYLPKLIERVVSKHGEEYQSAMNNKPTSNETYVCNYNRVRTWRQRIKNSLNFYLSDNHLSQYANDENNTLFLNYLFGIYLKTHYPEQYLNNYPDNLADSDIHLKDIQTCSYFISKNLKQYKKMDNQSTRDKIVISVNDMAVFFYLFLVVSNDYKNTIYELSNNQCSQIQDLYNQLLDSRNQENISLRESFESLVKIVFQAE